MPTDLRRVTTNLTDRQAAFLDRLAGSTGRSRAQVLAALLDQVEEETRRAGERARRREYRQAQGTLFDAMPLFAGRS